MEIGRHVVWDDSLLQVQDAGIYSGFCAKAKVFAGRMSKHESVEVHVEHSQLRGIPSHLRQAVSGAVVGAPNTEAN